MADLLPIPITVLFDFCHYCVAWRALAPRVRPRFVALLTFLRRESACGAAGGAPGPRAGETQTAHLRARALAFSAARGPKSHVRVRVGHGVGVFV